MKLPLSSVLCCPMYATYFLVSTVFVMADHKILGDMECRYPSPILPVPCNIVVTKVRQKVSADWYICKLFDST